MFWRNFWFCFMVETRLISSALYSEQGICKLWYDIRDTGRWSLLLITLYILPVSLWVPALQMTSTANCLVMVASSPLWGGLLSFALLGEVLPMHTAVASLLGSLSITSIFIFSAQADRAGSSVLGDLVALAAAICYSAFLVGIRVVAQHKPGKSTLPLLPIGSSVVCVGIALFGRVDILSVNARQMFWFWVMGGVMQTCGISAFTIAPTMIGATECALIALLETVLAPFWTWLALAEKPTLSTIAAGGALITILVVHTVYAATISRMPVKNARDPLSNAVDCGEFQELLQLDTTNSSNGHGHKHV